MIGRAAIAVVVVAHAATAHAEGVQPAIDEPTRPALIAGAAAFGGLAGLGLAGAIIHPKVSALGATDEAIAPLVGVAGLTLGIIAQLTSDRERPGRLRATTGSSTAHAWEYSLAYRARIVPMLAIEGAVLVANESWEQTGVQRHCDPFFGCFLQDVLVDARYEQMVSGLARIAFEPFPQSRMRPSLTVGGGPARVRIDRLSAPSEVRTGALFDATLAIEPAGFTAELGVRVGALDTQQNETAGYFRFGYSWGQP